MECQWKSLLVLVVTETCLLYYFHSLSPSTSPVTSGQIPNFTQKDCLLAFAWRQMPQSLSRLGVRLPWCPQTTPLLLITVGVWSCNTRLMWGSNENLTCFNKTILAKPVLHCGLFTSFGSAPGLYLLDVSHCLSWLMQSSQFSIAALSLFLLFFFCCGILGGKREKRMCSIATLIVELSTDLNIWLYLYSK